MMDTGIKRLEARHFEELIAFLNRAFGYEAANGFPQLLPVLYQPDDEHMRCQYAVRENGTLIAVTGVFPIEWRVADACLRVAGVGGVSVHPDYRGQGLMRRLMEHVADEIRRQGYDLSFLGGQRQRYRYFGWEKAGFEIQYHVTCDNIRHRGEPSNSSRVTLQPCDEAPEALNALEALHQAQLLHCRRRTVDFARHLRNWSMQALRCENGDGQAMGYAVWDAQERRVAELVATDASVATGIVAELVDKCKDLWISVNPAAAAIQHSLGQLAEDVRCVGSGNWRVLDWPKVIEALLRAKSAIQPLPPGRVVLDVSDQKLRFAVEVNEYGVRTTPTNAQPGVSAEASVLTRLLFGPVAPWQVDRLPSAASALAAWCPLPLYLSQPDRV